MPLPATITFRPGTQSDALCLSALATQVFLDTYATSGINADLANEASQLYSLSAFESRLRNRDSEITIAEAGGYLVGFLDLELDSTCPVAEVLGPEVLRVYVQAPFQRKGLGKALLQGAEARAQVLGAQFLWLTAWVGNAGALAFYPTVDYKDVGNMQYVINGKSYENRVFAKALTSVA